MLVSFLITFRAYTDVSSKIIPSDMCLLLIFIFGIFILLIDFILVFVIVI